MPVYEYCCAICHYPLYVACPPTAAMKADYDSGGQPCRQPGCGGVVKRRFSFTTTTPFEPHYNISQGQWVGSRAALDDNAKRASERATARTGTPHHFTVHDIAGTPPADFGVGEEGVGGGGVQA